MSDKYKYYFFKKIKSELEFNPINISYIVHLIYKDESPLMLEDIKTFTVRNSLNKFVYTYKSNEITFFTVDYICHYMINYCKKNEWQKIFLITLLLNISKFNSIQILLPKENLNESEYLKKVIDYFLKDYEFKDDIINTIENIYTSEDMISKKIIEYYDLAFNKTKKYQFKII